MIDKIKEGASAKREKINGLIGDVDSASTVLDLEKAVVLKALGQSEFLSILRQKSKLSFLVNTDIEPSRYSARGVSSEKLKCIRR